MRRRKTRFTSLSNHHEEETAYCDRCYKLGRPCILGPRIHQPNEVIPPDDDNFRQCRTCGRVYPRYALKHLDDSEASDIQPVDNPFDMISTKMEVAPFSQHGPRYFKKKMKQDQERLANNSNQTRYIVRSSLEGKDDETDDDDIRAFKRNGDIVKNIRNVI